MKIPIKRLTDDAEIPSYAHDGDAGLDLVSQIDVDLKPFERALIPTGIALELPKGSAALVVPRSGLALKQGISIVNAPGLIDSNYRGEIKVILLNTDASETFHVSRGDRIAQLLVIDVPIIEFVEVDQLDITSRDQNGFGSSGV